MSLRFHPSGPVLPSRLRSLVLIWTLCAAVICPAAWQSLSATLRGADAGTRAAATVAPTGWMWESFSQDGRQSALSAGRIVSSAQEARLVPARDARHLPDAMPAGLTPRAFPSLVLPEPRLAPAAWVCADSSPRLPATRGFFCRPPPSPMV